MVSDARYTIKSILKYRNYCGKLRQINKNIIEIAGKTSY